VFVTVPVGARLALAVAARHAGALLTGVRLPLLDGRSGLRLERGASGGHVEGQAQRLSVALRLLDRATAHDVAFRAHQHQLAPRVPVQQLRAPPLHALEVAPCDGGVLETIMIQVALFMINNIHLELFVHMIIFYEHEVEKIICVTLT